MALLGRRRDSTHHKTVRRMWPFPTPCLCVFQTEFCSMEWNHLFVRRYLFSRAVHQVRVTSLYVCVSCCSFHILLQYNSCLGRTVPGRVERDTSYGPSYGTGDVGHITTKGWQGVRLAVHCIFDTIAKGKNTVRHKQQIVSLRTQNDSYSRGQQSSLGFTIVHACIRFI